MCMYYIYTCVYIYIYMCVYVCIYIYIYTYIFEAAMPHSAGPLKSEVIIVPYTIMSWQVELLQGDWFG